MARTLGIVSRADLLRGLGLAAQDGDDPVALAAVIGYALDANTAAIPRMGQGKGPSPPPPLPLPPLSTAQLLQANRLPAVLGGEVHADVPDDEAAQTAQRLPLVPLPPDPSPFSPGHRAPPLQPLVRRAQLWPSLARDLRQPRLKGIDVGALVSQLSKGQTLRRLPRASRPVWPGGLWVVLDRAVHLQPFAQDFIALVRLLAKMRGDGGLVFWPVAGSPDEPMGPPLLPKRRPLPLQPGRRWPVPPAGTPVVILSDLGGLAVDPVHEAVWHDFAADLLKAGCRPQAWVPQAPAQVGRALAGLMPVHCLQPGAPLKAQRGHWRDGAERRAEQRRLRALLPDLRSVLACCVDLNPALMRALRNLHPKLRAEPALEALYLADHVHVRRSLASPVLTAVAAGAARQAIHRLGPELRLPVALVLAAHHLGDDPAVLAVELGAWRANLGTPALIDGAAKPAGPPLPADLVDLLGRTDEWLQALGRWADAQPVQQRGSFAAFARDLLDRQSGDAAFQARNGAALAAMWASTGDVDAPPHVPSTDLQRAWQRRNPVQERLWSVVQYKGAIWLWPDGPLPVSALPFARRWPATHVVLQFSGGQQRIETPLESGQALAPVSALPLTLASTQRTLRLGHMPRPSWAVEWGRAAKGLYALAPTPWGQLARLSPIAMTGEPPSHPQPGQSWARYAEDGDGTAADAEEGDSPQEQGPYAKPRRFFLAADDQFGLYATWSGIFNAQAVSQRFRYLPPGEFWMGSTDAERALIGDKQHQEWSRNESPRHRVRLTQGFWLADTACTQALWLAVMGGDNPSRFKDDPQNPVEQVSWDDVQAFLQRLQALLPDGCEARLPTEAEWEYACRAGTETAFSFGNTVTPEQVNCVGARPYAGVAKRPGRGRTVAVKTLPPNAWGLYEMHGNVWEWSADGGLRNYGKAKQGAVAENPIQPQEQGSEALRVFRGGSWAFDAHFARSASRYAVGRGRRDRALGFRLALRSSSASPAQEPGRLAPEAPQGIAPGWDDAVPAARRDAGPQGGAKEAMTKIWRRLTGRGGEKP